MRGGAVGKRAGIAALDRRDGVGRAQQRGFRQFARMRIAGRLAGHRAQAETLVGVEVGGLQPAIVEHQRFALAVFEIELAVVGAVDRVGDDRRACGRSEMSNWSSEDALHRLRVRLHVQECSSTDVGRVDAGIRQCSRRSRLLRAARRTFAEALEVDRDADAFLRRLEHDEGRRLCRSSACRAAAFRG